MLKHRLMSGFLIISTVVLLTNYLPPVGAWLTLVAIAAFAQLEFYSMANKAGIPVFRCYGTICGAAMISATFCTVGPQPEQMAASYKWENLVLMASMLVIFIRQFPQKHNDKPLATIACTIFGIFSVPFLFNYITRLLFAWSSADATRTVSETGRMMIFYLILVVKITDVGAYFTGRFLGRHKFFPRISPKKTWEGFFGGVVIAVVASWGFSAANGYHLGVIPIPALHAIILGFLLSIVGVIGDLFESLVKRAANVKDSGVVFPGMGGLLDVLDSLLFGAPILYVYATLFLKP